MARTTHIHTGMEYSKISFMCRQNVRVPRDFGMPCAFAIQQVTRLPTPRRCRSQPAGVAWLEMHRQTGALQCCVQQAPQHRAAGNTRCLTSVRHLRGTSLARAVHNGYVWRAGQWLENRCALLLLLHACNLELVRSAETDVDLPVDVVWEMWRDRTAIPNWMPWVSSVEILPEDTSLSRWVLRMEQFGQEWTFSWIAKDLTPTKFQKVHMFCGDPVKDPTTRLTHRSTGAPWRGLPARRFWRSTTGVRCAFTKRAQRALASS